MIRKLKLRNKLLVGYVIPAILLIISGVLSIQGLTSASTQFSQVTNETTLVIRALEELKFAGIRIVSSTSEFAFLETLGVEEETDEAGEVEGEEIQKGQEIYNKALAEYRTLNTLYLHDEHDFLDQIQQAGQALIDNSAELVELVESDASAIELVETKEEFEEVEQSYIALLDQALAEESEELVTRQETVNATVSSAEVSIFAFGVTALLVSVAGGLFVSQSITLPVNQLRETAAQMEQGNYDVVAKVESEDEIGQLAQAFNTMAEAINYRDQVQIANLESQLSETDKARARAEQADQVKSSFLASMSHELRTPLNAVINFSKFVANGDVGEVNSEQKNMLNEVVDSAKHLLNLINDVLDMSKIESGSLKLFIVDDVDVEEIVNKVASTARGLLGDKTIEIQIQIEENLPKIRGDRQRILQVLLNIMSNACKFTDEGSITLNAMRTDNQVKISVTDTGAGIAQEDLNEVFEAFTQTKTGLRQGGGTGLGMPITKNLVEAHGGHIDLESELKQGSTFTVSLPILSEELELTLA